MISRSLQRFVNFDLVMKWDADFGGYFFFFLVISYRLVVCNHGVVFAQ
jgi:hypothetical protein